MTKGKKQHNSPEELLLPLEFGSLLSDDQYTQIGAVLGQGRCRVGGRDLVLVNPKVAERPRIKIRRTPLGALAPTLLAALGLEDCLMDAVLAHARPRCNRCDCLAERSEDIEEVLWPHDGYVALVVDGVEESRSVVAQCEWLGAERAIVEGLLIRSDDAAGCQGEPVLNVIDYSRREEMVREIDLWFSRGGGALRLVHFVSRDATGRDLQRIFKQWRCMKCASSFAVPTRQLIEDAKGCARCRGEGWLLVDDDRLAACDDCDGFGTVSPFADYEFAGIKLKAVSACTIESVYASLSSLPHAVSAVDAERFKRVCELGFGGYPIGAAVELLSKGEKAKATIVAAEISRILGLSLAVDVSVFGGVDAHFELLKRSVSEPEISLFSAKPVTLEVSGPQPESAEVFTLRDIAIGPLSCDSLAFDIGRTSLVQGDVGSGKSLLLAEIVRRFSKRKKLAHLSSFGELKRCHTVGSREGRQGAVIDLLQIGAEVAREAARTRHARERGLVEDDFLLTRSRHLCCACAGKPNSYEDECSLCEGGLFDRRVGSVVVNNIAFAELMRRPLLEAASALWSNDTLAGLLGSLPKDLTRDLSFGSPVANLDPSTRRFLEVAAPLFISLVTQGSRKGDLFLVDTPFGTSSSYQAVIIQCIKELQGRGATIVCASVPEPLEKLFCSVVRLRTADSRAPGEVLSRFFDVRMARKTDVSIEG